MDKETLSNYGWIVICTLVLAVMIALATPFGEYVKAGVWSTTNGLNDTLNKNMEIAGLSGGSDNNQQSGVRFGEKYFVTECSNTDMIMTAYYIFYEDGSATMYDGEDTFTLPAGYVEYTETEVKPTNSNPAKILENGTKLSADDMIMTLESELPDGYAIFTDGTILSWTELKTKYSVTDTAVNNNAFADNPTIKSIVIPNSVTTIGSYAFDCCSSLTNITIPESVTTINRLAFRSCNKLTSITIPDSITSMGSDAFYNCSSLTCVYITDLTAWCNISFGGISANPLLYAKNLYLNGKLIKDLVIPSEITAIKNYAFNGGSFTGVTIPNTVTSIGSYAFYNCQSPPNITIPNSVTSIETYAFAGCKSLKSVVLPNIITTIPAYAFDSCSSLSNITIPNTVTSIGAYAFNNCSSLTDIVIPNGVTSLGSCAFSNSGITSVVIPTSVTSIGSYAFDGCSSLTNITIPKSVITINPFTFRSCTKLQTITFNGTISEWNAVTKGSNWKYRVPATATVICSDGTVAL